MTSRAFFLFPLAILMTSSCSERGPVQPDDGGSIDVQLAPPPPGQGVQLAVDPFEVAAGAEIQRNYYMKLPSDEDLYVTRLEFAYNKGSHHVNLFKSDTISVPDHYEETFRAVAYESWDMFAASQRDSLVWQLPDGVAIWLKGQQQLNVQVHYVNAATQVTPTSRGKVLVNLWTIPKESVTSLVGALFANNIGLALPPYSASRFTKIVAPFPWDVNILMMTGHFHSRGKKFSVWKFWSWEEIYTSEEWDEPPVKIYDPPLFIESAERLIYFVDYYNDTPDTIYFGPHVEKEEHANLFVFFYPGPPDGKAIYDIDQGW